MLDCLGQLECVLCRDRTVATRIFRIPLENGAWRFVRFGSTLVECPSLFGGVRGTRLTYVVRETTRRVPHYLYFMPWRRRRQRRRRQRRGQRRRKQQE